MTTKNTFLTNETFEQMRERMLAETARFIEWGLAHPRQVPWIPRHAMEHRDFSVRLKTTFWRFIWSYRGLPN